MFALYNILFQMTVKSSEFEKELQHIALIAKVLSHPARLAILKYLAGAKTCISGEIAHEIPLSRTTVSQHLQELKIAGLIKGEIDGTRINYCLNTEAINKNKVILMSFFQSLDIELNCDC